MNKRKAEVGTIYVKGDAHYNRRDGVKYAMVFNGIAYAKDVIYVSEEPTLKKDDMFVNGNILLEDAIID